MTQNTRLNIHDEFIASKIYLIRQQKVMLDSDLAELYEVETKRLKEAVRRNLERFPEDFMFELTQNEYDSLRTQYASLKNLGRGMHSKYLPYVFTEHGVLMLSSVLNNKRSVEVNIQVMRIFIKLRMLVLDTAALKEEVHNIKSVLEKHNKSFEIVADYLDGLSERLD